MRIFFLFYHQLKRATFYDFQNVITIIKTQKFPENKEEFNHFLRLIINFSENYYRDDNYIDKISKFFYKLHFHQILI